MSPSMKITRSLHVCLPFLQPGPVEANFRSLTWTIKINKLMFFDFKGKNKYKAFCIIVVTF